MAKKLVAVIDIGSLTARLKIFELGQKSVRKRSRRYVSISRSEHKPSGLRLFRLSRSIQYATVSITLRSSAGNIKFPGSFVLLHRLFVMPVTGK